jgi:hypothetical protein
VHVPCASAAATSRHNNRVDGYASGTPGDSVVDIATAFDKAGTAAPGAYAV